MLLMTRSRIKPQHICGVSSSLLSPFCGSFGGASVESTGWAGAACTLGSCFRAALNERRDGKSENRSHVEDAVDIGDRFIHPVRPYPAAHSCRCVQLLPGCERSAQHRAHRRKSVRAPVRDPRARHRDRRPHGSATPHTTGWFRRSPAELTVPIEVRSRILSEATVCETLLRNGPVTTGVSLLNVIPRVTACLLLVNERNRLETTARNHVARSYQSVLPAFHAGRSPHRISRASPAFPPAFACHRTSCCRRFMRSSNTAPAAHRILPVIARQEQRLKSPPEPWPLWSGGTSARRLRK